MIRNCHYVKEMGRCSQQLLVDGQTPAFGELLHGVGARKTALGRDEQPADRRVV